MSERMLIRNAKGERDDVRIRQYRCNGKHHGGAPSGDRIRYEVRT